MLAKRKLAIAALACMFITLSALTVQARDRAFPASVDPAAQYLFYMHGLYIEKNGPNAKYRYYDILDALERAGFTVIGEARGRTDVRDYARGIARQVGRLIDAGVPPENITVAGHSRGGFMSMITAAMVANPGVSYGVLAGCALPQSRFIKNYLRFVAGRASEMRGRFLIMWPEDDDIARDCKGAMAASGVEYRDVVLPAGRGGHQLFYKPIALWLDPLVAFARGG